MLTDVALVVDQESVEDEPEIILVGEAVILAVGFGLEVVPTNIVNCEVVVPEEFVAVNV